MCKAFSCLVLESGDVKWQFGVDSHSCLMEQFGVRDIPFQGADLPFAKVEITPLNRNYIQPDKWVLKIDESITPSWWTVEDEKAAFGAHKKWLRKLRKVLINKPFVNPLTVKAPRRITKKHIALLCQWASVWASVWASMGGSVEESVWYSVWASVGASVRASVWASMGASVEESVWASVRASMGASVEESVWASV
ncbi:MAG: hypothetical protein KGL39_14080, partial [Patescibacteria group bacterium]|nr:hypothetical protein [Patescibacteria group bacterium]